MKCKECGCEMEKEMEDSSMESEVLDEIMEGRKSEEKKPKAKKVLDIEILKIPAKKK